MEKEFNPDGMNELYSIAFVLGEEYGELSDSEAMQAAIGIVQNRHLSNIAKRLSEIVESLDIINVEQGRP